MTASETMVRVLGGTLVLVYALRALAWVVQS